MQVLSDEQRQELETIMAGHGIESSTDAIAYVEGLLTTALRERDEARAKCAAMLLALREMAEWHGAAHDEDCPMDDTCECSQKSFNDRVNASLRDNPGQIIIDRLHRVEAALRKLCYNFTAYHDSDANSDATQRDDVRKAQELLKETP